MRLLFALLLFALTAQVLAQTSATQISAGNFHTCAVTNTGTVRCWGEGALGRLGYGNQNDIGNNESPSTAGDVSVGAAVSQVSAGAAHTCALTSGGSVRCWGQGDNGRLGYGNQNDIGDNESPSSAGNVNVGATVSQVSAGGFHTCVVTSGNAVRCWGSGFAGRLGYGNQNDIGDNESPSSAGNVNVGTTVTQVSAGRDHTCAVTTAGGVRCWGEGSSGRLGYGNQNDIGDNESPSSAGNVNVGTTVTQVSAGGFHTCAVTGTGGVRCWGEGSAGRLGYGNENDIGDNESPSSAGNVNVGTTVAQISTGASHTCAVTTAGGVRCWGANFFGELGYANQDDIGDNESPSTAGDVNVGTTVTQVTAGSNFTCALTSAGQVRCWGAGGSGRLGYGNTDSIGDDEDPATAGDVPLFDPNLPVELTAFTAVAEGSSARLA